MSRAYLIRRLLITIPSLLGISIVLFTVLALAPGDPFEELATNPAVPPEVRAALRAKFGLDDPVWTRYLHWLDVSVKCAPDACSALVPSFLVQPLVENAVKHGVARSSTPVKIEITASLSDDMLCINVENGLGEREATALLPGAMNSGLGLINVRRRLHTVYGERATLTTAREDGRFVATICIPQVTRTN